MLARRRSTLLRVVQRQTAIAKQASGTLGRLSDYCLVSTCAIMRVAAWQRDSFVGATPDISFFLFERNE